MGLTDDTTAKLRQRVQTGILEFTSKRRLTSSLSIGLYVGFAVLLGYLLWMGTDIYTDVHKTNRQLLTWADKQSAFTSQILSLYNESKLKVVSLTEDLTLTKNLYEETQQLLVNASQEIEATKAMLSQTEQILNQTKAENSQLQLDIQGLKDSYEKKLAETRAQFEGQIASLEAEKTRLTTELSALRDRLNYYMGDIRSIEEGRALLAFYRNRAKVVRSKIGNFRRQAREAHAAALKEVDKIKIQIGNNGYFVKDGQSVKVDLEKYNALTADSFENLPPPPPARRVDIDVTVFE